MYVYMYMHTCIGLSLTAAPPQIVMAQTKPRRDGQSRTAGGRPPSCYP